MGWSFRCLTLPCLLVVACGTEGCRSPEPGASTTPDPALPGCPSYTIADSPGTLASAALVEVSGLAASRAFPGVLWTHNDSGDRPRVFAMGRDGGHRGTFDVTGARASDWEELALAPSPQGDQLYIGDIGDNARQRATIVVYRIPEPNPTSGGGATLAADALRLRYPDGAHDAEAMLVDPTNGDLFLVTKERSGPSQVFRAPAGSVGEVVLEPVGEVSVGGFVPGSRLVTAGSVSTDGTLILLRTYEAVHLWVRSPNEPLSAALARPPCPVPVVAEPQGEAITFLPPRQDYLTVSEGAHAPLHLFVIGD